MPRARPWTEYEQLILRKALREGGYPLAEQRLPRRTRMAIRAWATKHGLDPAQDHRLDLVTAAEASLILKVTPQAARTAMLGASLQVRRGKYALGLRCQIRAHLACRPLPIEALESPELMRADRAAERLRVTTRHFENWYAAQVTSRVPARLASGQTVYLYPLDDVLALRAS